MMVAVMMITITCRTSERTCQAKRTLGRPFGPLRSLRLSVLPEIHLPVLSLTRLLSMLIGPAHSRAAEHRWQRQGTSRGMCSPPPFLGTVRTDAIPLTTKADRFNSKKQESIDRDTAPYILFVKFTPARCTKWEKLGHQHRNTTRGGKIHRYNVL